MRQVFYYDRDQDEIFLIRENKADRSDAGCHDEFVVEAADTKSALDAARRWVERRADDDNGLMPEDLGLVEREWKPGRFYLALEII